MNSEDLKYIEEWFKDYSSGFLGNTVIAPLVRIKQYHTARVVNEIAYLVDSMEINEDSRYTAIASAWLHDVGRFEQAVKYGKMFDYNTENHAVLGVKVLQDKGILDNIHPENRRLILTAIANHNKFRLNGKLDEKANMFCRLLRDADKLDIMDTIIKVELGIDNSDTEQLYLWLPERNTVNHSALQDVKNGDLVRINDVETRNDFRLLMCAWVYDLNFTSTFKAVAEREYIDKLEGILPETEEIKEALQAVKDRLRKRIAN